MRAIDLVEIHEAFAAQVLANAAAWQQGWKGPATDRVIWDRVNVNGSSISIGHPWSATGGRILTTLANEMARRDARYGLVSMCAAGAMAGAVLLTRGEFLAGVCQRSRRNARGLAILWGIPF